MGYVLPGWLDEILDFIGINWPNVDEDDYREMADAMREFADKFEGHGGDAHAAVNRILASSEGYAVDALKGHWGKVKGSHLDEVPKVARLFAKACDVVADVIYGMKVKAEQWFGRKQRPGRRGSREDRPGRVRAIVTDLVGRPTELVDETGHIAWHTRATLWGTTTWNKDATAYTPLRFPGQYADLETGLHHNYFRHYDPELGRFAFPDPLGLAPADNPVAYVASPLVWSDPLGITPCKETFYRVMSKKEFDRLGPNGQINVRGENFADKYTHLVQYEMEPGTRDALIAAGRGSGDNIAAVRSAYGIDLEEIGNSPDFVHVKMEREGLNFGLRSGSVDVFNSRIKSVSHELL